MAQQRANFSTLPTDLIEALHDTLALKPADDSQRAAQSEMVIALYTALDARRQRIVISESAVGTVKWVAILLQGLCTLVAIAIVHSDNRRACAITLMLFATGIALSVLLIAAYSRPFTSVGPELLKQVIASEAISGMICSKVRGRRKRLLRTWAIAACSQPYLGYSPANVEIAKLGLRPGLTDANSSGGDLRLLSG